MMPKGIRKVHVLRKVEIEWGDLKKGDIFRTVKVDKSDIHADEETWCLAIKDCEEDAGAAQFKILSECILDNIDNFAPSVIKTLGAC